MEQKILSVSDLNNRIKGLLDLDPMLQNVCVKGELSNYKVYPSGHHYFTLKDAESSIRCVMFKGSAMKLRFRPESGMGVLAIGRVSVYPRDGAYQLYCSDMRMDGLGDLYLAFEQLKARLAAEGLFDSAHKKPIPRFPATIAVITSGAGAAVRDIIRVSRERWPMSKIIVMPVRVQGVEAPAEIRGAIAYANRYKVADLIITGRGGGSIEDLWAFNDERVARAIYDSEIPVISAVGHEPDITISDFVADLRAATPSNGAELAVPDQDEMRQYLDSIDIRSRQALTKKLEHYRRALTELASRPVLKSPTGYIELKRMQTEMLRNRLLAVQERRVSSLKHAYVAYAAALDALSPLKVLARGYAVASGGGGKVIKSTADTDVGESIDLILSDGALRCRVEEKLKGEAGK